MIGVGDDVIISGKVIKIYDNGDLNIELRSGDIMVSVREYDIKSVHPYQPIPETDERRGQ